MGTNKIKSAQESSKFPRENNTNNNFLPDTAPVNKIHKNSKILKISDYVPSTKCPPCV